jgi:parallel beta-helix repeat protein
VPKDYPTIQLAINNAAEGDTVKVASGIYYEHVAVNKSIRLVGEDRDSTVLDGKAVGTVLKVTANNVHISYFTIRNGGLNYGDCGVHLSKVSDNTFKNNKIINCYDGIILSDTRNSEISDNIISNNTYLGLLLLRSNNNIINKNTATFNGWSGIELQISENNILTNNIIQKNTYGIRLLNDDPPLGKNNTFKYNQMLDNKYNFGFHRATKNYLEGFLQNIDTTNTVNGKPVHYLINKTNQLVDSIVGYLAIVNSKNITVKNLYLSKNCNGLLLAYTDNSLIENLTIANNDEGIKLFESNGNKIYHNNFINNTQQVFTFNSNNIWNDETKGNYWSDYKQKYPDATEKNGVWNTPYAIDANNVDKYPLTQPYR